MADEKDTMTQWNDAFFENPARAAHHLIAENNKALEAKYRREAGQEAFWKQLYGQHPHLKQEDPLVRQVLAREFDVLMGMSTEDAIQELAHHAHQEIEKQSKRRAYQSEYSVFSGSPDGSSGMPTFQDPQERSLGAAIKARKERRRNSQYEFTGSRRVVSE